MTDSADSLSSPNAFEEEDGRGEKPPFTATKSTDNDDLPRGQTKSNLKAEEENILTSEEKQRKQTRCESDSQGQPTEKGQNVTKMTTEKPKSKKPTISTGSMNKPPEILPQKPISPNKVHFYLLILGNYPVKEAEICVSGEDIKPPLYSDEEKNGLWYNCVTFDRDPKKFNKKYKYCVRIDSYEVNNKDLCDSFLTIPSYCEELNQRELKYVNFDVFRFPDNRDHADETVSKGQLWYLKWFLKFVKDSTISDILTYVANYHYKQLHEELAEWILQQASANSVTVMQRLYLFMVLNLYEVRKSVKLSYLNSNNMLCDCFLECFATYRSELELPKTTCNCLKKFAITLVKNCSSPGWLTLAAHFYPHLGVKFLLESEDGRFSNYKYDTQTYEKMIKILFLRPEVKNSGDDHRKLMSLVLKNAPTFVDALNVFKHPEMQLFFDDENQKVEWFVKFYLKEHKTSKKKSLGAKLLQFHIMPENIRVKITELLHSTLLEYAKSDDQLNDEDTRIFFQLIATMKDHHNGQLVKILNELAKSKSVPHQNLLLQFLKENLSKKGWEKVSSEEMKVICKSWIFARLSYMDRVSSVNTLDKVKEAYQSIEKIITACSFDVSIVKYLVQEVSEHVSKLFQSKDAFSVLQASTTIETLAPAVQECYIFHVRAILKPSLIKKICLKRDLPNYQYSICSLNEKLLRVILENTDVPEFSGTSSIPKEINDENDFMKILEWGDIWIVLLGANKMLEKLTKFQNGKKICQLLAKRIEEGNISIDTTIALHKERQKVSLLCESVLMKQESRQVFENRIVELMDLQEDCAKKINFLDSVINFGKKVCEVQYTDIIGTIDKTFMELKRSWHTKRVNELLCCQTFWGELHDIIGPAEALHPLVNSLSFMTLAKKCLQKLTDSAVNDEGEAKAAITFNSLMKCLSTEAMGEFQRRWKAVLKDPGSTNMEAMNILLVNVQNQSSLDDELKLIEGCFCGNVLGGNAEAYSGNVMKIPEHVRNFIDDYVKYRGVFKQVEHFHEILKIFKLADRSEQTMSVLLEFLTFEKSDEPILKELHSLMEKINRTIPSFSDSEGRLDCAFAELSKSNALVSLVEEIVDEDIRFLIDAVEERSDQFVSEQLVSDFINVHGSLADLVKKKNQEGFNGKDFFEFLKACCHKPEDIARKIKHCRTNVNSLRGLYKSVANRGEITKEIICNCLKKGEYTLSQTDGKCEVSIRFELQESGGSKTCNYTLSQLHELRSRAYIIVFTESGTDINFNSFIQQVNLLTEVSTLLSNLFLSGCPTFQEFNKEIKTKEELEKTRETLHDHLENWKNKLKDARKEFYFLNYYRSKQICTLYDFLSNGSNNYEEVLPLIHFVNRTISVTDSFKPDSTDTSNSLAKTVGKALEDIFCKSKQVGRSILHHNQSHLHAKLEATVTPGKIFVACLKPESLHLTANVILTLYENTTGLFPDPPQIVFCSSQTKWEELHLLLQRCFAHSRYHPQNSLFCIANVESLPNELQFRLVDAIKEKQTLQQSSENEKSADYQLALICRGGDHHHIVEQFVQYSHHIAGMSDLALADRLKSSWPDVKIFTSALPGLGKTEQIKCEAAGKNMNVVSFPISGPIEPMKLIKRFKKLKLNKKYHCLHLDIGEVDDALSLDTFLFQLIITGMVSAGNQFYHLPTTHIYIEIANTLKSFLVLKCFTRIHLEWQNYENLLVSDEITSKEQVVCQYLHIVHEYCIESKEVHFSGPERSPALPNNICKTLLANYFSNHSNMTFTMLNTFLAVFADQLLKFSKSAFFKIANLKSMVDTTNIRTNLFHALMDVSKQFATRSITNCRSSDDTHNLSQKQFTRVMLPATPDMVERVKGMVRWEDSNHLYVVFHGYNSETITAIYRNKCLVPLSIEKLLTSQNVKGGKELEDFKIFTQEQLQEKLEKIACTKLPKKTDLSKSYALTPDNILKMISIILRVRVHVPVIIMGETGCGKTSLVNYLAKTCGVDLQKLHLHAGISEEKIIEDITKQETCARGSKEQIWVFLDEINTCDHLGLISNIMCHHSLLGRSLPKNLVFLAACNPYKLRHEEHIKTAGLESKDVTDERSKLVYRVHPLPKAMIDYVWDYGSLGPKDERDYIHRMVKDLPERHQGMLVDLLAASQKFIRDAEKNPFCVSLRDVNRCIHLISWFEKITEKRQELNSNKTEYAKHLEKYHSMSERYNEKPMIKSIVLALTHCYMSRLPTAQMRKDYRRTMIDLFGRNGKIMTYKEDLDSFLAIVRMEEEDFLNRMELPPGTARNAALRENVFVMLVCILNRIPIFVVGKPGCSKSLSMQLIRSNLRGRDSRDPLFRELPQLYVVSYQGSESSTSEGIIKVFEKAHKYRDTNKDILPVVLLDEVGLAENSKYNPLKVLHSLLEPGEGKLPDVAVVGISNWSLDAAKMNRAIHLSIPEPTEEDLCETGRLLYCADGKNNSEEEKKQLQHLTKAYHEYQTQQTHANFHGLRDYYSLMKSLTDCRNFPEVKIALQRNFGGLRGELISIQKIFLDKLQKTSAQDNITVTKLIEDNLKDRHARHLMLITNGDSAIDILKQSLAKLKKETITIYGSRFEEDLSEEYNYRILSRIILCMERDCILILKDLEAIYGSLYDMLNQNYAVVGGRKNCRVALGPHSNPMCHVNDGFRCIVLIDYHKVDYSDPPFLNRFEKQVLRFSDVLTDDQRNIIDELHRWVQGMSTVDNLQSHWNESDMFIGFREDTLPSLVLSQTRDTNISPEETLKKCKDDLMWIASPDAVLRTQKCIHLKEDPQEVVKLSKEYFEKPLHQGFASFMEQVVSNHKSSFFGSDKIGSKTVILTFSNIHTDIGQCLASGLSSQVERLSAYKSEKQLAKKINEFWDDEKQLLVLQCKLDLDARHLLLARLTIEKERNSYKQRKSKNCKHVCIVVHVQRGQAIKDVPWQFNFLCGWRQVFLDVLEAPPISINEILGQSVREFLTNTKTNVNQNSKSIQLIRTIAQNHLLWCFSCIKYTRRQRPVDTVLRIAKDLFSSKAVLDSICELILKSIDTNTYAKNWQIKVACDLKSLINSSTLFYAMQQFVSRLVQIPLAKIVYFLEKENAWPPHIVIDSDETLIPKLQNMWCSMVKNYGIVNISDFPEPLEAESFVLEDTSLDLYLPFSQLVSRKVDGVKKLLIDFIKFTGNEDNSDKNDEQKQNVLHEQLATIISCVPELGLYTSEWLNLYVEDVIDITTANFSQKLSRSERASIVQAMFLSDIKQILPKKDTLEYCIVFHTFLWRNLEQISKLLNMVDCCQQFITLTILYTEESNTQKDTKNRNDSSENESHGTEEKDTLNIALNLQTQPKAKEILFQDTLITAYCEKMIPSQQVIEKNGGLKSWMQKVDSLLSAAFRISEVPTALHYLRMCLDFSNLVDTLSTNFSSVYNLNKIGNVLRPKYLDHADSFETITNQLIKPLEEEMRDDEDKKEALQMFSASFYVRCIDTNVDSSNTRPIVEHFLSSKSSEMVLMMSPVILQILRVEENCSPGIFTKIITAQIAIKSCPCLQIIDEVFKERFSRHSINHDSYPSVMICDLIQDIMHFGDGYTKNMESLDEAVSKLAKSAKELITRNSKDDTGLRILSAVAFLRRLFTMIAQYIGNNPSALKKKNSHAQIITEIISLIKDPQSQLSVFFMKQFYEHTSIFHLQKWFAENNVFPTIRKLQSKEQYPDKAVYAIVFRYPEYKEANDFWSKLKSSDVSSAKEFLNKCCELPDCAFALLGLLINKVYLKRTVRNFDDKETKIVDWFANNVASFPTLLQDLLLRVVGRRDFHCQQLQLSTESSVEQIKMALLVLHIACVVATRGQSEMLPMYRYFTNPASVELPCLLAHCKEEMRSVFEYQSSIKNSVCITCACGARLAFKNNVNEKKYPHCPEVMAGETRVTSPQAATTLPISSNGDTYPEWEHCTEQMSPAVYRALRFIVYSSFYGGISLQTSEQELSSLLSKLHGLDIKSGSAADFCFEKMESDLSCLTKILNCKKDVAIQTMHLVVEKSSGLIRGDELCGFKDCSTPTMRREWESMFSKQTETVLLNARKAYKEVKEMMKLQQTENNDEITLECRILELDKYPQKPKEQNKELKRLFRVTQLPCFEDFRSAFILSSKDVHEKRSFLTLFFKKIDQLLDIGHLHHLLKWSRIISSALTHRISRKDAQFKSIDDFITGHLLEIERSEEEREGLERSFDNFKKAWNKMCPLINQGLENKTEGKMPRLARTDHIGYCLTEGDYAIYLKTAIKILVDHQNAFLDAIISLSSENQYNALSFVKYKNGKGIMSTTLQDVQEKEIINFQWSNDVFMFAQNNLEYGEGHEIKYDFERIERWLARKVAFGKCYLEEKLNQFIFANELFHFCDTLLMDIRSLVTQSPSLPDEVLKGVSALKKERIKDAQDLLQHIEVLMYLQKRKLNDFTMDMTLEELVNKWVSILPNPFPIEKLPKPSSLIRIKHVAALYEALEDVLSDAAIEALDDKFKETLPEEELVLLMKEIDQLKPNNVLKVLRRYVFRYLSSEQYKSTPKESDSLLSCLEKPSLWSPPEPPKLDGIPKEIALKHIYFIVKHLEKLLAGDEEENTRRPSADTPSRGRRQGGTAYHGY